MRNTKSKWLHLAGGQRQASGAVSETAGAILHSHSDKACALGMGRCEEALPQPVNDGAYDNS